MFRLTDADPASVTAKNIDVNGIDAKDLEERDEGEVGRVGEGGGGRSREGGGGEEKRGRRSNTR